MGSWLADGSACPSLRIRETIGSVTLDCDEDAGVIRTIMKLDHKNTTVDHDEQSTN
jgi:hypothetical protein